MVCFAVSRDRDVLASLARDIERIVMRAYSITSAVVLVSMFSAIARANIIYGPVVDPANNEQYYVTSAETWTAAEADAASIGEI